jgi:SP family galactose:H+ symporter-like MFS transporter
MIAKKVDTKKIVIMVSVIAALAGLLFGVDIGIVNGSLDFIQRDFNLTLTQGEKITSILSIGALIAALFSGFITRKLGRQTALVISGITFTVFSLMAVTAANYDVLLIARFCLGLAVGLSSFVAPMYLGELAPTKIRGAILSLYQLMIVSGMFVVFVTNDILRYTGSWRLMFSVISVFAILFLIGTLLLPKSPRWLVLVGKEDKAREILQKVREDKKEVEFELQEIKDSLQYKKSIKKQFRRISKLFLKILAVGVFLQLLQQFCGVNAIGYYSTNIFTMAGLHNPYFATIIMGGIKVLATIVAIMYVDKLGRKPILYIGLIICVISTFFLGFAFHLHTAGYQTYLINMIILLTSLTFQAGYSVSLGPIVWMMCAEIFPLEARDLGITVTTATNWFGNAVLTRYVLSSIVIIGASYTFWIFGAICLIGIFIIMAYVPETKDVPLEELEMNLKDGVKLKNLGTRRI